MIWAVIAARSGSKGLKNKNILKLNNYELLVHSIKFAKKLKFLDKVFISTDSIKYKNLSLQHGGYVPFLRSKKASSSRAMEEDVLDDIRKKCEYHKIKKPDHILWLRPTTPIRSINCHLKAYSNFITKKRSTLIVGETDPRIFLVGSKKKPIPVIKIFKEKSMVRRQDCSKGFKIFYGEYFKFPKNYNKNFLGKKFDYFFQPIECNFDIDNKHDLDLLNNLLKTNKGIKKYSHV